MSRWGRGGAVRRAAARAPLGPSASQACGLGARERRFLPGSGGAYKEARFGCYRVLQLCHAVPLEIG